MGSAEHRLVEACLTFIHAHDAGGHAEAVEAMERLRTRRDELVKQDATRIKPRWQHVKTTLGVERRPSDESASQLSAGGEPEERGPSRNASTPATNDGQDTHANKPAVQEKIRERPSGVAGHRQEDRQKCEIRQSESAHPEPLGIQNPVNEPPSSTLSPAQLATVKSRLRILVKHGGDKRKAAREIGIESHTLTVWLGKVAAIHGTRLPSMAVIMAKRKLRELEGR